MHALDFRLAFYSIVADQTKAGFSLPPRRADGLYLYQAHGL